jgi:hypothetical protein
VSSAQTKDPVKNSGNAREEVLDFEGDIIETSVLKPDATLIGAEVRKAAASLLKIRKSFVPEIVKSAEDI